MTTLTAPTLPPPPLRFEQLLQQAHELGKAALAPHSAEVDRDARFPHEALQALREAQLLSAYVPRCYGGQELDIRQVVKLCEALGQYCSATAMIFAMHQIQVACIVHHAQAAPYFQEYLRELVSQQRLIASATTETGVGGDLRSSRCAVEVAGATFQLTKSAPVISYGDAADDILITCRRGPDAAASDQVQVLVRRGDFTTTPLSNWDTLGFRGTCSAGFVVKSQGNAAQILPEPFASILAETMHPVSHLVWSGLWSGIAINAVNQARAFVRAEARKTPGETPISAIRLGEVDQILQEMRHNVAGLAEEYHQLLTLGQPEAFRDFGFSIRTNNLKLSCSQRLVDIVSRALLICGISGYRNDSPFSLSRQLRDAYGAALMVNNDRILKLNATMLLVHK
jgi:acyl-CoA dehydrogenase